MPSAELPKIIDALGLLTIYDSFFLQLKGLKLCIRKENFHYTIIIDKTNTEISKESCALFHFPGLFGEDEEYIYYTRIPREALAGWTKNFA